MQVGGTFFLYIKLIFFKETPIHLRNGNNTCRRDVCGRRCRSGAFAGDDWIQPRNEQLVSVVR